MHAAATSTGLASTAPRAKDPRAAPQAHIARAARAPRRRAPSIKPEFEYELLSMFVRNELSARVTLPLLAVIFSLASMFWAPVVQASAWLATVISVKFFMIAACRRFLALPRSEMQRRACGGDTFIWLELASGIAWGGIAVVGPGRGRRRQPRLHPGLAHRPARHPHDVRLGRHDRSSTSAPFP